ncbi:MAG: hypothetical protein HY075_07580 [Deltaproteobacteria bacterium]|nr:hypothetical protein [Deltaproteobacteria bacterium]
MLKRKAYPIAIGIVAAQLTIAGYIGDGSVKKFGDCATCGAAAAQNVPFQDSKIPMSQLVDTLNQGLAGASPTGYRNGNTINSALLPGSPKYDAYVKAAATPAPMQGFNASLMTLASNALARNPLLVENGLPIVPPQMQLPTQQRIDSLFPANWGTCIPLNFIYPSTPMFSMPSRSWMI